MSHERLREMREAFDGLFARPVPSGSEARESFLAVRLGGDPYALRLTDLTGLERRPRIAPVFGGAPGLLGLAGLRARLVPVYSLATLLGYGGEHDGWSWLALTRTVESGDPIGLALDEVEGLVTAAPADLYPVEEVTHRRDHVFRILRTGHDRASLRGVVGIESVLSTLGARTGARPTRKE